MEFQLVMVPIYSKEQKRNVALIQRNSVVWGGDVSGAYKGSLGVRILGDNREDET
jgi:hypothetical protein